MTKIGENYWETYYREHGAPEEPSLFAQYVVDEGHVHRGDQLVELGCGNGRDARFLAAQGISVLAVDQCVGQIGNLSDGAQHENVEGLEFVADDFTELPDHADGFDAIYSRFTLHSVRAEDQLRTLQWAERNLREGGKLCIETRGQKNEIYQSGTPVEGEEDAFIYEGHYRRFVDFNAFVEEVTSTGLSVIHAVEDIDFAPFEDTNYHFIRVIAEKQKG